MADKKISQLVGAATPLDGTEVLPIVKSGSTVKVANNDLRPKQIQSNATSGVLQVVGPTAAATRVMTVPDTNFTAARTDAAQTFTGNQAISAGTLEVSSASAGVTVGDLFVDTANKIVHVGRQSSTGGDASSFQVRGRQGTVAFQVDPGNPSITASADLTMNNANLVIGTSGRGIDFSATTQPAAGMTSELLADYEEGTWTVTAAPETSGTITQYAGYNVGSYTKIGRMVTVSGFIYVQSVASPVGNLIVTGLPYAIIGGDPIGRGAGSVSGTGLQATAITALALRYFSGDNKLYIDKFAAGSLSAFSGDVKTDTEIWFTATYPAA
jgi:hypothetical protein